MKYICIGNTCKLTNIWKSCFALSRAYLRFTRELELRNTFPEESAVRQVMLGAPSVIVCEFCGQSIHLRLSRWIKKTCASYPFSLSDLLPFPLPHVLAITVIPWSSDLLLCTSVILFIGSTYSSQGNSRAETQIRTLQLSGVHRHRSCGHGLVTHDECQSRIQLFQCPHSVSLGTTGQVWRSRRGRHCCCISVTNLTILMKLTL